MKRVLSIFTVVLFMCVGAWCTTVTSTTKIVGPDGQPFNGTITLQLPFAGVNSSTNQLVLANPVTASVINGTITQPFAVTGNDLMSPAMPYSALYTDSFGTPVTRQLYYITGPTFDVGLAPATPNFLNSQVVFANSVVLSGNIPTSPALGATGGALNVQKTNGGTAIYNARFLDSFGNTNQQIIGVDTEQLINPPSNVNYLNFVHVDEGAIPTTNTVNFTGGDQTATYGSMSDFGSGTLNSLSGGGFEGFNAGPATATLIKGVTATANNGGVVVNGIPNQTQTPTNNGNATNIRAFDGVAKNLSSGTVTNGVVFYAEAPQNTGGGTFTNAYGLFVADMTAAINNFAIKTGVGKVSIGDAATFNSTMAVGTTPVTTTGILENNSNLTGTFQFGYQGAPVCSSASTSLCEGIRVRFDTAAASFTVANGSAVHITEGTKGAGSAITNEFGLNIDALSNGGTNIAIQVANPIKSTLATGTAPFVITSTTPVANLTTVPTAYDHTGAQITAYHLVEDSCVLGTSCGVTLAGSSVYTSSTSYTCTCQDETAIASCKVAQTAGNGFTITGTGTDTIRYHCGGN